MKQTILNYFSNNYKLFYEKFLGVVQKIGGDEYKAICPYHEDSTPSFNFNNQTGRYFCHGCGKKGDIFHFYGKIDDLDTRRNFGKILKGIADDFGIPCELQKIKIVKVYDYYDASGEIVHQTVRKDPKEFAQRRPDGKGGFIWNLKGIRTVLYNLPAVSKTDEVIIVEGEKDCDNLAKLGFTATTCPMGAKKWRPEYNDYLKGKNVVLIPDNDNDGREHMTQVGASLKSIAKSLKWLDLPNLPSKGDVTDFIKSLGNSEHAAEKLATMIDQVGPYEPPQKATIEDVILPTSQFYQLEFPTRQELLFPWLKSDSINLVSGWRGCGKTWFGLSILDAVSKGNNCGPWECKQSVPCLFVDGEMTVQDDRERIETLNLDSDRKNTLYIYSDAYANLLGLPRAHLNNEKWRQTMKRILTARKVKLWVVDNLASLASGLDENIKKDWDPINQWLLELRFAGISTIMLHHVNKEGGQRGTSAREDNLDISIVLKQPSDYVPEDGARFVIHFSKSRVQTKYLNLIGDTEFKLIQDENGKSIWSWGNVKREAKREIITMLDKGFEQKAISEALGITKGYVSQIKKQAIKDGLLSSKCKLTQSGFYHVSKGENY
jgi:hypothetical protein